jgi:hypothetical protein
MSDQLYLSLWFPNFRLQSLPAALTGVLRQFAAVAGEGKPSSEFGRVAAASAYPIDWTESPTYQRIFVNDQRAEESADVQDSIIENAVAEATEQLHEDTAYEFEMRWLLWQPRPEAPPSDDAEQDATTADRQEQSIEAVLHQAGLHDDVEAALKPAPSNVLSFKKPGVEPEMIPPVSLLHWKLAPARVRVIGFGPDFDSGSYDQNGHVRVEFGLDTPWILEDESLNEADSIKIKQNVEKLLAFTLLVEKNCGISSRLLWTESGEPLAEKLIARLQRLN